MDANPTNMIPNTPPPTKTEPNIMSNMREGLIAPVSFEKKVIRDAIPKPRPIRELAITALLISFSWIKFQNFFKFLFISSKIWVKKFKYFWNERSY